MADKKISELTASSTPLAGTEVLPIVKNNTTVKVAVSDLTAGRDVATAALTSTKTSAGAVVDVVTIQNENSSVNTEAALFFAPTSAAGNIRGARISAINDGSNGIGLKFYTGAGATITSKFEIESAVTGNATLTTGNLIQGTAAKGINFTANTPAAGMTSQLLNWYEEGTWTPTITAGSGSITAYTSAGYYTRIGRQVFLSGTISISNNGTGGTNLNISNLPFAIAGGVAGGMSRENAVNGKMSSITASGTSTLVMFTYDNLYPGGTGTAFQFSANYFV